MMLLLLPPWNRQSIRWQWVVWMHATGIPVQFKDFASVADRSVVNNE
ncbi:dihydroorotase [marine gamma proteobacterium HTCC2143]|uniref:Dihydroorotase n=1 Tax=marine gamma proteobacterium HTCC2143 TaxID=247633 RepID=A0YH15_9GAMM|nr:dihydroorotase [marine gamma proteobacterium HTCC2143]